MKKSRRGGNDQYHLGGDDGAEPEIVVFAKRADQEPGDDKTRAGETRQSRHGSFSGRGMALRHATVSAIAPATKVAGNSIGNRMSQ